MKRVYRFTFPKKTRRSLIEQAVADAIYAVIDPRITPGEGGKRQ